MDRKLILQSEFSQMELKHHHINDAFSLNLSEGGGDKYLTSYSREEFEELSEAIEFLLKRPRKNLRFSGDDISNAVEAVRLARQGRSSEADYYERRVTIQPVPEDLWQLAHAYVDNGRI